MHHPGQRLVLHNAVTGLRAAGQLVRWPLRTAPGPAADALIEHQSRTEGTAAPRVGRGRQVRWLLVQAVLGPAACALTAAAWCIALVVVTTPLWWWLAPPAIVFVPVTDVPSSLLGALCGTPLVLIALACPAGTPPWAARCWRAGAPTGSPAASRR
ncbi:hypothetical protein [Lentzea sp. NPDC060358]|uniref:hypothetical protein n=1 Tax=Lentzea sp. NPDC060358 TaxID=3347103 RepID=UPI00364A603B